MTLEIKTINLPLPLQLGNVNCYLVETQTGFILIDTGGSNQRAKLLQQLENAGCQPGNLRLIMLTHGDFDHTGNAAYLRDKFGAKIAMHRDDLGMVECGDMFWNRRSSNVLLRVITAWLFGFGKAERFTPDFYLKDGDDLAEHGLDAQIIDLPGHSSGSVGILTDEGDLFCGDLLANVKKPDLWDIIDDPAAAQASVEKLKELNTGSVYPGHGTPFPLAQFLANNPID